MLDKLEYLRGLVYALDDSARSYENPTTHVYIDIKDAFESLMEFEKWLGNKENDYDFKVSSNFIQLKLIDLIDSPLTTKYADQLFYITTENLSDGQAVYLHTFSSIYAALQELKDPLLVLDEPDLNMHPEWSRNLIQDLSLLANLTNSKCQIVLSSHSPYVATDIPSQNIYLFNKYIEDDKEKIELSTAKLGFASNIIELVSDTYFLNYSFGEFAKKKIQDADKGELALIAPLIGDKLLRRIIEDKIDRDS